MESSEKSSDIAKISIFRVIGFGIRVYWKTLPVIFIINNVITVLCGTLFGFTTFMTQSLYDSVSNAILGQRSVSYAYFMIFALSATFIVKEVLNGVNLFLDNLIYDKTSCVMSQMIHSKMARIDPVCMENEELYHDIDKATAGAGTILYIVYMGLGIFTFNLPYFMFMWAYLHNLKPQFVFVIVLVFVPVMLSQYVRTGIMSKFEDRAAPIRREQNFYYRAITDREYFKETRTLGAYSFFIGRLMNSLKKLGDAEWKMNRRTNVLELLLGVISAGGYAVILCMLVSAVLDGQITVGAFAAVFGSIGTLFTVTNEMINNQIGDMAKNMGMAYNFIRFMDLPERRGTECEPDYEKGIIAENISFSYPNSECKSIDGVSLHINAGETIAVVGENGAGKTTLVRLLTGLYTPSEGRVILNGMDTSKTGMKSLFSGVSGVFQKFQRYQMTLRENIHISDVNSDRSVEKAAKKAGIPIGENDFPDGENTMLSREFGGVELSGGQWQRVAIARGLYRFHHVIVLDEPTAAIDPMEESRIYKKFIEISRDKTSIIITHRLGSAKIADRVVVMDQGKIVGIGTHHELLHECSVYAEMYRAQAAWYEG